MARGPRKPGDKETWGRKPGTGNLGGNLRKPGDRRDVPRFCVGKPGKPGDRRDVPRFSDSHATEAMLNWPAFMGVLLGRPPFRGVSARDVDSSKLATNSGLPSGRPVCVECRRVLNSDAESARARKSRHPCTV